ncbi:MAG: gliding motility-associated C-terminal domain-containing protein [Bacteroidota bacterium]|nr:gliding motility-associated C-terminal domain-containing protein [Bacteroidota bacterium]
MKKSLLIFIFIFLSGFMLQAQNLLLFTENFQTGGGSFTLNGSGPGPNTGTNEWIVNSQYTGAPTYQNTYPEDSTYSGTIAFAPYSEYLHIHDAPSGITNTNYNPSNPSDKFAFMTNGICTMGMDSVHFSFFYLCQGSATAYGEVYYSVNNGPWVQTGLSQYSNKYKWKYEDITSPAFANVNDIRFGFRWLNDNGPSPDSVAFAVDDINVVGEFNNSATITVTSVTPNPVCQGGLLTFFWTLSDTLCDGTYAIDLSDQFGNFTTTNTWVANIFYPQMSGAFSIILPTTVPPGTCYKIRIRRTSPAPFFTGIASGCFSIVTCPNVITTLQPVVTFDTNAVCIGSVIDVPFYSTGVYSSANVYTAQLSDSNGVFAATPPIIGSSPDPATYDPMLGSPPGSVGGIIPVVPPGCGYYIRVVSSNPAVIGAPWGPFCIGECDINTNNSQDLSFCVTDCAISPAGADSVIDINVNTFNTTAVYNPGNVFETQLLSSLNFAQIGANGILGSVAATGDTTLNIHIPCKDSLPIYGLPTGMNYLRVVATNSTVPDNSLGSLIRLTIGAPRSSGAIITSYDFTTFTPQDTFCVGDIVALFFSPYNYSDLSTYMWQCNGINGGNPFVSPSGANSNSLYVNLGGTGTLNFMVQETNNGCVGPWSPVHSIVVLGAGGAPITGPHIVCQGDTNTWMSSFQNSTYYSWNASGGTVIDTANNIIDVTYPIVGTYQIILSSINQCGSNSQPYAVTVKAYPTANAGNDTVICGSTALTLATPTGTGYGFTWSNGSTTISNTSTVVVTPTVTTTYYLQVSVSGGCISYDTITVIINTISDSVSSTLAGCNVNDATATVYPIGGSPPYTYSWSNSQNTQTAIALAPGTYFCIVTDAYGCSFTSTVTVGSVSSLNPDAGPTVTITAGQSTQLNGTGGTFYSWTPAGDLSCSNCQNPVASPTVTTTYTLTVSDSLGCTLIDTVTVIVDIFCGDVFVPNAFSPNGDNQNDILYVRGACIETMDFYVFNRLGEQVFHSTDPAVGWNGTWRGVPCETAVFTYVVKGLLNDGTGINLKGNVSLIK